MDFGIGTFALGYLAGVLSTLSPCVLPLVPILVATAMSRHRFGAVALACGLAISFTVIGLFIATIGVAIGLDQGALRLVAAILLIAFGLVLLVPQLQDRFTALASGAGGSTGGLLHRIKGDGWSGQFAIGLLLGIVWSPCVGPTLGATTTLAAQGAQLPQVAFLMLLFGIGAGTPLVVLGTASREVSQRLNRRLMSGGKIGKGVLGVILIAIGLSILTGFDKAMEAFIVDASPMWLTNLTTRY